MEMDNQDVDTMNHDVQFSVKITGKNHKKNIQAFDDPQLGLNGKILENIKCMGHDVPTPVQCYGMPQLIAHNDVMCCSCTGSGKTAAYLLPISHLVFMESVNEPPHEINSPKALILSPTRELAEQICSDAKLYCKDLQLNILVVYGGDSIPHELRELKRQKIDILIATPGRLYHLLSEFGHILSLTETKFLVIDEADEMFNRNFFPQINNIVQGYMKPKEERVSAMFSATFPRQVQYYARRHLRNEFVFVVVGTIGGASPNVIQEFIPASEVEKQIKLLELLHKEADKKILIFSNTIVKVDILVRFLLAKRLNPAYIHSGRLQHERDQALADFNEGKHQLLVATSVASRGLNLAAVSLVINYDLPDNVEDYVQRIGRAKTNKNGDFGVAISFYDEASDADLFPDLMFALKSSNQVIPQFMVDGNQNQGEVEKFDEVMNDDLINKMKKFQIAPTFEQAEEEWWG